MTDQTERVAYLLDCIRRDLRVYWRELADVRIQPMACAKDDPDLEAWIDELAALALATGERPAEPTDAEELAERCCAAFYRNWSRYSPAYRQAKHTRWAKALRTALFA